MELSEVELRVLGSLIEKQLTTPQQYPLTLNALTLACNQTTARDPVSDYATAEVERGVTTLKQAGLARFVHPSHGRSVLRYHQLLDDELELSTEELALVALLALRGPQTSGELRQRSERMAEFTSVSHVEEVLRSLAGRDEPIVVGLGRRPGQKEGRYGHLLGAPAPAVTAPSWTEARPEGPRSAPEPRVERSAEIGALRAEVGELRAEVAELRAALRQLRDDLGT